ncbi:NAD(+)/NADH kinase [Desulfitobacterium hafniense]|uniref:NAD kinase n=5 Tax=root TaxID=1 RepID=Q24V07_DESHY|nr:NAD(+)/NADH kinase [Desulfitobacterium hafniense]ACL21504.1 ATP-NAD/AcoX kinase [Desulfitobacterium hafniense DCB-2]EHL07592.1 NAD(+)/NADH kinase [Desulfitobacterium hafniense DP7]KTE89824.1 NAD+ kinase [Desulfitobacterium hafniense]MEA5023195.1 NAD(+)/NADH kinase [Desulfitobacterium hafniense]CDX02424.1 Inorganic polyphosphate/ATP-NAD kinase [Desulfitobacterium hafniense]
MDRVGLWINHSKPEAITLAGQITHWFAERGWDVYTDWEKITAQGVGFLISLGGDGTLLEASREAAPYAIPVLGVNLGRLGFLCEIERNEIFDALEKITNHDYSIQERLMLTATVNDADQTFDVLNDVVFLREPASAMVTLQANLTGEPSVSYPADGLIVSTPTGSTAYALSAGGPIMSPNVEAILLTPLAAHSLSARPMVISDQENIEISLVRGEECIVSFDGYHRTAIKYGEKVVIKRAPINALLIRLGKRSFPRVVREKLKDRWHE